MYSLTRLTLVSSEEIPSPRTNIPKAIAMQMVVGLITAFIYLVALFYSVNDFDAVLSTGYTNPLAEIYLQATGSRAGSLGLLIVIFFPTSEHSSSVFRLFNANTPS